MLNCPFCDAELGAASNRLRGGRCPKCGSILSWAEEDAPQAAPRTDDDALPMSDIVRTLVQRGSANPQLDATIATLFVPAKGPLHSGEPADAPADTYVSAPPP